MVCVWEEGVGREGVGSVAVKFKYAYEPNSSYNFYFKK